jgi:6-pyruvoyl-tetrahydropterin synthase
MKIKVTIERKTRNYIIDVDDVKIVFKNESFDSFYQRTINDILGNQYQMIYNFKEKEITLTRKGDLIIIPTEKIQYARFKKD